VKWLLMAPAVQTFDVVAMGLPAAPVLPVARNDKFGTFSFYGQLSGKLSDLPPGSTYSV
jgi:hypothetical protein